MVDEGGNPLKSVLVSEQWQHYSIETKGHEAEAQTDAEGRVVFPERVIKASLLRRGLGPMRNVLRTGLHSSFGPVAYLIVLTGYEHTTENAYYAPGQRPPQTIIVRRAQ